MLREEAGLGVHADAMKGSHALEALTRQVAEQAWTRFETLEAAGGWRGCGDLIRQWTLEGQRAHLARPWYVSTDMSRGSTPWAQAAEGRFYALDPLRRSPPARRCTPVHGLKP